MYFRSGISQDYTKRHELCAEVVQLQKEGLRIVTQIRKDQKSKQEKLNEKRDKEAKIIRDASMETIKG